MCLAKLEKLNNTNRVVRTPKPILYTYPLNSNIEPRRILRRWLAVTGKGPECAKSPILIPIPLWPPDVVTEIDCERLSRRGFTCGGCINGIMGRPLINAFANVGSEPRAEPAPSIGSPKLLPPLEPQLSRRNKPMTDLGCLGLFIPPFCVKL